MLPERDRPELNCAAALACECFLQGFTVPHDCCQQACRSARCRKEGNPHSHEFPLSPYEWAGSGAWGSRWLSKNSPWLWVKLPESASDAQLPGERISGPSCWAVVLVMDTSFPLGSKWSGLPEWPNPSLVCCMQWFLMRLLMLPHRGATSHTNRHPGSGPDSQAPCPRVLGLRGTRMQGGLGSCPQQVAGSRHDAFPPYRGGTGPSTPQWEARRHLFPEQDFDLPVTHETAKRCE